MNAPAKLSRTELDAKLDALATWVATMLAETEEHCQMDAFAGHADEIEARTAHDDHDHYWSRVQCILRENAMVPGDDEPYAD